MPRRYRADPRSERISVEMEGMAVIYHRPSGITHLLAAPAPEILDALSDQALDVDGIAACLAAEFEIAAEDEIAAVVADRLIELEGAGLVARI